MLGRPALRRVRDARVFIRPSQLLVFALFLSFFSCNGSRDWCKPGLGQNPSRLEYVWFQSDCRIGRIPDFLFLALVLSFPFGFSLVIYFFWAKSNLKN